jgi:hypothetical protein
MDHRWDDSTWRDHAARAEHERYGARRIQRDPEVEQRDRDRLRKEEMQRLQLVNRSPWDIGVSFYDQRDLYTRNNHVDEDGYGRGPTRHPQEGSYAYPRRHPDRDDERLRSAGDASVYEREAWPWLNYHDVEEDPFFGKLLAEQRAHEHGIWQRIKRQAIDMKERVMGGHPMRHRQTGPKNGYRSDDRIKEDVNDALTFRGDLDATDIEVSVKDGEVTLEGTVRDRHSKRIAEEVVEGIRGVHDVHNRLTIRHDEPNDPNVAFVLPLALLPV